MERRLHERIPACSDCVLRFKNNVEVQGKLWDISEGGVCVAVYETASPDIGDTCTIQFSDEIDGGNFMIAEPITVVNVIDLAGGYRVGASFINKISQSCLDYIHVLSSRAILRNHLMRDPLG